MVLAGPGSGKTHVLIERIVYLVEHNNVEPDHILAITFSRKAAEEIRDRLASRVKAQQAHVSTFHAFGLSVLKTHHELFGRGNDFQILDHAGKKAILRELPGMKKQRVEHCLRLIEAHKQGNDAPEEILQLIREYNQKLEERNAFDLEDLLCLPVELLEGSQKIASEYRKRYPWILIDEFQDINAVQYALVCLLCGPGRPNIFMIGDPNQAIYGFRGSDVRFIHQFQEDYPDVKRIRLECSYRCPGPVLEAAAQVLMTEDHLRGTPVSVKLHIQQCETEKSEADWIAAQVEKMIGGVRSFSINSGVSDGEAFEALTSFSDFGVLCRASFMFDVLADAFQNHGVPCQIVRSETIYERPPLEAAINLFRDAFYGRGLEGGGSRDEEEVLQMIERRETIAGILDPLMNNVEVPVEDQKRVHRFVLGLGADYETFFHMLAIRQGVDDHDPRAETVSLMTMHAAKGLEFNAVFIPGCEQGVVPFERFGRKTREEMAEEERLFYVGITRAKKYLFLTYARKRAFRGKVLASHRSTFLDRIDASLLTVQAREPKKRTRPDMVQPSLFDL